MNTKFTAAAQAIAEHFKQAEAARGEPFRDTFTNPMNNDAVTPNFVGIPLALLRALVETHQGTEELPAVADAESDCRAAYENTYHKVRPAVSYDDWSMIWRKAIDATRTPGAIRIVVCDVGKVSNPDAGAVLQPAPAFDQYSGR